MFSEVFVNPFCASKPLPQSLVSAVPLEASYRNYSDCLEKTQREDRAGFYARETQMVVV